MWYFLFMSNAISPSLWAERVKASYNHQLAQGIDPPFLDETLLWATPGLKDGDCFTELGKLGLEIVTQQSGVILQEIEPSSAQL